MGWMLRWLGAAVAIVAFAPMTLAALPKPDPNVLPDLNQPNAVVGGVDISNQAYSDQWSRFCQDGAICKDYDDIRRKFIAEYREAKAKRRSEMERELAASMAPNGFLQWGRVDSMLGLSDPSKLPPSDRGGVSVHCSTYISRSGRHVSTTCW